jgi:hypothetical protein
MTLLGLLGILISIAGFRFARANESRPRLVIFIMLVLAHIGASIMAYIYSERYGGDTLLYYYDLLGVYGQESGVSTVFVINFVQFIKAYLGGSFLDYFLLFQSMGIWGLFFVMRAFDDIHQELGQPMFKGVYLLLFLPGLHFWTSAIGKDAPVFLGVAMCVWAAFRLRSRYVAFGAGIAILLLVRPHIALMALVAWAMAIMFARNTSALMRAALMGAALVGIASVAGLLEGLVIGLNFSSTESLVELVETRSQLSEEAGGDVNIMGASFPVKLLSLLFRPFFVDATGALGYLASLENVVLLGVILALILQTRTALAMARTAMFARFAFFFFLLITFLLALFNYNVGLGLRQKMMMMPALLVFFAALMAVRTARKRTVYGADGSAYADAPATVPGYRRA